MHHGGALRAQSAHCLEHVHDAFVLHALQHRGQRDEHAGAAHARAIPHNVDYMNMLKFHTSREVRVKKRFQSFRRKKIVCKNTWNDAIPSKSRGFDLSLQNI